MSEKSRPAREAITYAFVAKAFGEAKGALHGLTPLFAAAIATHAGQILESSAIASTLNEMFDLDVSPLVVEGMVPALLTEGVIEEVSSADGIYRCLGSSRLETGTEKVAVESLFDDFRKKASEALGAHGLEATADEIDTSLLDALTTSDVLSISLNNDATKFKPGVLTLRKAPEDISAMQVKSRALTFLSAEFIRDCLIEGGERAATLVSASWGALIAEVVLSLQRPTDSLQMTDLTVYVDGPILLDSLDLGAESDVTHAQELVRLIKKAGARLCTFEHMFHEMQEVLRSFLVNIDSGMRASGPLLQRVEKDRTQLARVRAALPTLSNRLEDLGVEIVPPAELLQHELAEHFSDESIGALRVWIAQQHLHFHVQRDLRDAQAVGYTIRARRGQSSPSISSAIAVFVTKNPSVVRATRSYLESKRLLPAYAPSPCVSDRQLAGVLWFCTGGGGEVLTRVKLAANCASAVQPRNDLVAEMARNLLAIDPNKQEEFVALLRSDPAAMCLMQETLGVSSLATADSAERVLNRMRDRFKQEAGQEFETRLREMRECLQADASEQAAAKQVIIAELESKIAGLQKESLEAASQSLLSKRRLDGFDSHIRSRARSSAETLEEVRRRHSEESRKAGVRAKILISVLFAEIVALAGSASLPWLAAAPVAFLLGLAAFWAMPEMLFGRIVRSVEESVSRSINKKDELLIRHLQSDIDRAADLTE